MSSKSMHPVRGTRNVHAFHRALLVSFGAAALSLAAVQAHADQDGNKAVVRYTDLDLSKPKDAHTLYVRLQSAAERVCGDPKGLRDLRSQRVQKYCYEQALARAVDDIGHSSVQALYAADDDIRIAAKRVEAQPQS